MNLSLHSFYKSKFKTILSISFILFLSVYALTAQMITTYDGNGVYGATATGTSATSVKFQNIGGIVTDGSGNL